MTQAGPLEGMRRDFLPSDNSDDAPRLVVFEVINRKLVFAKRGCAHFAKRSEARTKGEVREADCAS